MVFFPSSFFQYSKEKLHAKDGKIEASPRDFSRTHPAFNMRGGVLPKIRIWPVVGPFNI